MIFVVLYSFDYRDLTRVEMRFNDVDIAQLHFLTAEPDASFSVNASIIFHFSFFESKEEDK